MRISIYKYRRLMSYGRSKWNYHVFVDPCKGEIKEYFVNKFSGYDSEQHRGCQWEKVKCLPKDVHEKKVNEALGEIQYQNDWIKILKKTPKSKKNQVHKKGSH